MKDSIINSFCEAPHLLLGWHGIACELLLFKTEVSVVTLDAFWFPVGDQTPHLYLEL